MNIIIKLPVEIKDIIKPYVIGYRDIITDKDGSREEIWIGPREYHTGIFREWYPGGQISREWTYHEGNIRGTSRWWSTTGVLLWKGNFFQDIK